MVDFICLECFHEWSERTRGSERLRCPMCISSSIAEKSEFDQVVEKVREVRSELRTLANINEAKLAMAALADRVRPGPLLVVNLYLEILSRARPR